MKRYTFYLYFKPGSTAKSETLRLSAATLAGAWVGFCGRMKFETMNQVVRVVVIEGENV